MDIVVVIAIIVGPIFAIQAQQLIEHIKQKREEKRKLFMTLMATRGRPLLLEHVQALNMIDIIFSSKSIFYVFFRGKRKKERAVIEAWSEFRDHLYNFPKQPPAEPGTDISAADRINYKTKEETWLSERDNLLIELLVKMAESLNYHFDKVLLKRGAYTPQHYGDVELQQMIIQRGLSDIFLGLNSIPIHIVESPQAEEAQPSKKDSSKPSKESTNKENPDNNPPTN